MNIAQSFSLYMQSMGFGTPGTDLYIGSTPQDAPAAAWWIIASGGSPESVNHTNEMIKSYNLEVRYRDTDHENVYNTLQEFEEFVNSDSCIQLQGFDTISIEASFHADQDMDSREQSIGLVVITVRVYSN